MKDPKPVKGLGTGWAAFAAPGVNDPKPVRGLDTGGAAFPALGVKDPMPVKGLDDGWSALAMPGMNEPKPVRGLDGVVTLGNVEPFAVLVTFSAFEVEGPKPVKAPEARGAFENTETCCVRERFGAPALDATKLEKGLDVVVGLMASLLDSPGRLFWRGMIARER